MLPGMKHERACRRKAWEVDGMQTARSSRCSELERRRPMRGRNMQMWGALIELCPLSPLHLPLLPVYVGVSVSLVPPVL